MVHDRTTIVNALYCWRDLRGLVHLARRTRNRPDLTLCGLSTGALNYAGREDVSTAKPTCICCARIR